MNIYTHSPLRICYRKNAWCHFRAWYIKSMFQSIIPTIGIYILYTYIYIYSVEGSYFTSLLVSIFGASTELLVIRSNYSRTRLIVWQILSRAERDSKRYRKLAQSLRRDLMSSLTDKLCSLKAAKTFLLCLMVITPAGRSDWTSVCGVIRRSRRASTPASSFDRRENDRGPGSPLSDIMPYSEKKGKENGRGSRSPLCVRALCFITDRAALFSFIAVTRYDVRALRAHQGKEYRVIDGIINSAATNRAMYDRPTGIDCELTNLFARRRSVEY